MDLVNEGSSAAVALLQNHGWKIVGALVAWYMVKDEVLGWLGERQHKASLARANDPKRVSVLEEQRMIAREKQQIKAAAEAEEKKRRAVLEKAERARQAEEKKRLDLNQSPLDGGGRGGGGSRPVRRSIGTVQNSSGPGG